MATIPFDVYHTEIYNFLRTVTIKFEPFTKVIADSLVNNVDPNLDVENVNYYYKRLKGEYIPGSTEMYVTSIDTGERILFTKENLKQHPKTAGIYRVPNPEYDLLCKKYPNQIDLIKSIAYPIDDTIDLSSLPKIAYISGNTSLLQSNESESIVSAIKDFCKICEERWWVKEYCFEEGYPVAFYGMLWYLLPLICFTKRMTNIKTSSVHPFHIWEYLCSKGLEDYRDILTIKQSLFLYRNMEYILSNKGTSDNLYILADNILDEFSIALFSKMIYQQQHDRAEQCRRTPEIISRRLISALKDDIPDTSTFETIETINGRMYTKGIETNNTLSYVNELEKRYGEVEEDRLPTKLLELKKETVSSSYEALLIQFIYDTLAYQWHEGHLAYTFTVTDPVSNVTIPLTVGDGLALLYYLGECSLGNTPETIPSHAFVRTPYRTARPKILPKSIYVEDIEYQISQHVDIDTYLSSIPFSSDKIETADRFVDLLYDQFSAMVQHIQDVRGSADLVYTRSMWTLEHFVRDCCAIDDLALTPYSTYEEFFAQTESMQIIKDSYYDMHSKEMYDKFFSVVFSSMVPIRDQRFKQFVGFLDSMNSLVEKLMSLCIQLFSHNVTFLGTDRDKQSYLYLTPLAYHHLKCHGTSTMRLADEYLLRYKSHDVTIVTDVTSDTLEYHTQKDVTVCVEDIQAYASNITIVEYGISADYSRFATNITYNFS